MWIREKTKFITYLAGKLTDLYSDNKPTKIETDSKIQVSWSDTPALLDLDATEIADIENPYFVGAEEWLWSLAYQQFTPEEIENGKAVEILLDIGIL